MRHHLISSNLACFVACLLLACSSDESTNSAEATDGGANAAGDAATSGDGAPAPAFPPDEGGPVAGGVDFGPGPFLGGDCDPLVPTHCGFPFPTNVYLTNDPSTATGKHVEFPVGMLPRNTGGVQTTPDAFRLSDGFSPGVAAMTHLP